MKKEKKAATIGVRLTPAQYKQFNHLAEEMYLTGSSLGRILFEMYLRKEITIRGLSAFSKS